MTTGSLPCGYRIAPPFPRFTGRFHLEPRLNAPRKGPHPVRDNADFIGNRIGTSCNTRETAHAQFKAA